MDKKARTVTISFEKLQDVSAEIIAGKTYNLPFVMRCMVYNALLDFVADLLLAIFPPEVGESNE